MKASILDDWLSIMSAGDPHPEITFKDARMILAHLYKEQGMSHPQST